MLSWLSPKIAINRDLAGSLGRMNKSPLLCNYHYYLMVFYLCVDFGPKLVGGHTATNGSLS
jgi:hypothetical protein